MLNLGDRLSEKFEVKHYDFHNARNFCKKSTYAKLVTIKLNHQLCGQKHTILCKTSEFIRLFMNFKRKFVATWKIFHLSFWQKFRMLGKRMESRNLFQEMTFFNNLPHEVNYLPIKSSTEFHKFRLQKLFLLTVAELAGWLLQSYHADHCLVDLVPFLHGLGCGRLLEIR